MSGTEFLKTIQPGCPVVWHRLLATGTVGYRNSSTKPIQSVMLSSSLAWTVSYRNSSTKTTQSVMLSRTAGYRNSSMNSNGRMAVSHVAPVTYQWEFCTLCIWHRSGMLPGKRWMTNSLHAPPHLSPGKETKTHHHLVKIIHPSHGENDIITQRAFF